MRRTETIEIDGVIYQINIIYKRVKNIHFRFKGGCFEVTCHYFTKVKTIKDFLSQKGLSLIKRSSKPQAIDENSIYIFGKKYKLSSPIEDDETVINFDDKNDLKTCLKSLLKNYIYDRLFYYFDLMGIDESYIVRIKENSRVLGSNSRQTKTFSFSLNLIHYSKEIIDSVIVHECAHCFVFNHSKDFYDIVYKFFPNYNQCRKKLIHSIYA